jgi:hypothetical protein
MLGKARHIDIQKLLNTIKTIGGDVTQFRILKFHFQRDFMIFITIKNKTLV